MMSAIIHSYFICNIDGPDDPSPKPRPEWPPTEPTPQPPDADPAPTVPPVTASHFSYNSFVLN